MTITSDHIRLIPVSVDSIPKASPELGTYLTDVVSEASTLIETLVSPPKAPWSLNFNRSNKFGRVQISSRSHHIPERIEYWFARSSTHEVGDKRDNAKTTLMWCDFKNLLFHNHSENEREYGPSVIRVDRLGMDWDISNVNIPGWEVVQVAGYAVHHHLPWPFNSRVFPILLILVSATDLEEFMVISLPIKISSEIKAINTETQQSVLVINPKTTVGRYVSVERVTFQGPDTEGGKSQAIWKMATASDASGNIPMAIQRRVIGTSIFHDVEAFILYAMRNKAAKSR
ncbi:hypothetical protein TWF730_008404 [Orbilia blumenaviensis]|uniref:DUF3074 domain-containing protein n=1 Tax=Orbilia blumenaviensis TaxID=1796055 RepID=A0AAV9V2Z6_9PEZI